MADSMELLHGARSASPEDAQAAYDRFSELAKRHGYIVGITGSTLFGEGQDVDLLIVASQNDEEDQGMIVAPAASFAQHILKYESDYLYFYEQDEDGSSASIVFRNTGVVIDMYVQGIPYYEPSGLKKVSKS